MGRADATDELVELYVTHHRSLLRFATLVAPEDGMAEDLVQEAFVRLQRSWHRLRDTDKAPAYLRSTIANLAKGRGRRLGVARRRQPPAVGDVAGAEEHAMAAVDRDRVIEALRALSPRQRACIVLRYYEGQSESEIAATLGIGIGSVRTHMHRGMTALEATLGEPT